MASVLILVGLVCISTAIALGMGVVDGLTFFGFSMFIWGVLCLEAAAVGREDKRVASEVDGRESAQREKGICS